MAYPEWFEKYNKFIKQTLVSEPYYIAFIKNGIKRCDAQLSGGEYGVTYKGIQLDHIFVSYLIEEINEGIITENHFQIIDDIVENDILREIYDLPNK